MEKLEIVARDENVDHIAKIIDKYGKTGKRGDGLIYANPVISVPTGYVILKKESRL
ncbi:MAG: P-II family nitrogen regulator [Owenweeksia sp.]|nr:P-II family nitrogen regulator [Owenweeksia sp.]